MPAHSVTGPIAAADLGFTLMHEHVHTCSPSVRLNYPQTFDREAAIEQATRRLKEAYDYGVRTVVEPTTADMGRDVAFVAEVSRQSGVNVISATGLYLHLEQYFKYKGVDHAVELMMGDIEQGVAGTGIRVGMIKCAIDHQHDEAAEFSLRVGGKLQAATGLPVTVHTSVHDRTGEIACRILEEEGAAPSRVIIGHCGDSQDVDYLISIAERGYTLGMDRFGIDVLLDMPSRIATVAKLCERGFADRMIVSHDCSCWKDWMDEALMAAMVGPEWHFTTVPKIVIPALIEHGVSQADIDQMTIHTPARLLTI